MRQRGGRAFERPFLSGERRIALSVGAGGLWGESKATSQRGGRAQVLERSLRLKRGEIPEGRLGNDVEEDGLLDENSALKEGKRDFTPQSCRRG